MNKTAPVVAFLMMVIGMGAFISYDLITSHTGRGSAADEHWRAGWEAHKAYTELIEAGIPESRAAELAGVPDEVK